MKNFCSSVSFSNQIYTINLNFYWETYSVGKKDISLIPVFTLTSEKSLELITLHHYISMFTNRLLIDNTSNLTVKCLQNFTTQQSQTQKINRVKSIWNTKIPSNAQWFSQRSTGPNGFSKRLTNFKKSDLNSKNNSSIVSYTKICTLFHTKMCQAGNILPSTDIYKTYRRLLPFS